MPVKLGAKLPPENAEARIEIIPLIDIMFFLLAAFMLVSLSMVNLRGVKVNLPTATSGATESAKDLVSISVDANGAAYLDKIPIGDNELAKRLAAMRKANPALRVFISGDRDARHGAIIHVLDLVRSVGIDKVTFELRQPSRTEQP